MICPRCQADNPAGTAACQSCGFILLRSSSAAGGASAPGRRRGLAITSLVLGVLSLPTLGLLGIGAILAIVLGIVALVKASNHPAEYGGKGLAIGGIVTGAASFVLIPFVGIIAAIAIPSLLRARVSANEAGTLSDVRTVISAQAAYQASNGGFYDTLECLASPATCIPNYSQTSSTFLDAELASASVRAGYRRALHLGPPPAAGAVGKTPISPTSVTSFAYVAVPLQWNRTGVRAFCGDSSGVICVTRGQEPGVVAGSCAQPCEILQ